MGNATELLNASRIVDIKAQVLVGEQAVSYIQSVLNKFKPLKITGHLAIDNNSKSIKLEDYEFSYSSYLPTGSAYVFFDQESRDKDKVVIIEDGNKLCEALENAYGMEYFVSNKIMDYLLAVNWYTIEGAGSAKSLLSSLEHQS